MAINLRAPLLLFTAHIGQAGVIAFFVHTSLVLMDSLQRLSGGERPSRGVVLRFYLRRLLRIYPLALVCITMVVVLDLPAMTWRDNAPLLDHYRRRFRHVLIDESPIHMIVVHEPCGDRIAQDDVCAGTKCEMDVCAVGHRGSSRIDHDEHGA